MQKRSKLSILAPLAFLVLCFVSYTAKADTVIVTPANLQGWTPFATPNANVAITSTNPRSGNGSIELNTSGANTTAAFTLSGNFGQLSSITNLQRFSFE